MMMKNRNEIINPRCILRGLCNAIIFNTIYDLKEWLNPKLSVNGTFTIYLPFQQGFGHEDIDLIAESITRFEIDRELMNGTYSIRFYARTSKRLSTAFEITGPYSPEIRHLARYIWEAWEEWHHKRDEHDLIGCDFVDEETGEFLEDWDNYEYSIDVEEIPYSNAEIISVQTQLSA